MELAQELLELNAAWRHAGAEAERQRIWRRIQQIHADQLYSIGIVCCTPQPIVVSNRLRGVPETGVYGWEPGAYFGIYMPDTFWFDRQTGN